MSLVNCDLKKLTRRRFVRPQQLVTENVGYLTAYLADRLPLVLPLWCKIGSCVLFSLLNYYPFCTTVCNNLENDSNKEYKWFRRGAVVSQPRLLWPRGTQHIFNFNTVVNNIHSLLGVSTKLLFLYFLPYVCSQPLKFIYLVR